MIDDHKYSIGRTVVYNHPNPASPSYTFGQYGPERTVGVIRNVEMVDGDDKRWEYVIENVRNQEIARVSESDILFATLNRRRPWPRGDALMHMKYDSDSLAEMLNRFLAESALSKYLSNTIRDLVRREESEERARREGRDLPLQEGDYIRVRGDLRSEVEPYHNYYAKVLKVEPADIGAIEAKPDKRGNASVHRVVNKLTVLLEDGTETQVYDPEVKLYYTAEGRKTILNWRAATFLAESFGDEPPYTVEYSYLEDHVFSRDELEGLSNEQLIELFAALLYVKGHMGLRDYQKKNQFFEDIPKEYLVDSILASSRFNMRKNRSMTEEEIHKKHLEGYRLKRILKGK